MGTVARTRVVGPLAAYADGFRAALAGLGYTQASAEIHVWLMGRLSRWLVDEGVQPGDLNLERVDAFLAIASCYPAPEADYADAGADVGVSARPRSGADAVGVNAGYAVG